MKFTDRHQAGQQLAAALQVYQGRPVVVYALPRGGVVLGTEVAKSLTAPLDLIIPRKIGHPLNPEYAVCATTESGILVCNQQEAASLDQSWLSAAVSQQQAEAARRRGLYLATRQPLNPKGRTAIIVDDGVATGLTMLAAIEELKTRAPSEIVVAIPVVPTDTAEKLRSAAGKLVALEEPLNYQGSVGAYYRDFPQVEDSEVLQLLAF